MKKETAPIGIMEMIRNDEELSACWNKLSEDAKQHFIDIDERREVPDMLSDVMFKGIFDPRGNKKPLSSLVSAIIGRDVRVIRALDKEGYRHSKENKGIIFDFLIELEDGTLADVEMQRKGAEIPSERTAVYSSEMVVNQFASEQGKSKSSIDYGNIHRVYSIIIIEKSVEPFASHTKYHHHFEQTSDTGIELELLQYYDFVCLDVFKKSKPRIASKLTEWLDFLTIRNEAEMMVFVSENPEFEPVYNRAVDMMADRSGLMQMISNIFANENILESIRITNETKAKREIARLSNENADLRDEVADLRARLARYETPATDETQEE